MFIGIDPGLRGAIVALDARGLLLHRFTMPVVGTEKPYLDLPSLNKILRLLAECLIPIEACYLEFVASRPGQSAPSTFKFGRLYGAIEALLVANEIAYTLVTPKVWTKVIHEGISGDDPKEKSLVAASRLFPTVDFRATERSKVAHDGLVDAALIAEYGRRKRQ